MEAMEAYLPLQEALTCSLCDELFKQASTFSSTCGHTFCWDCVINELEGPGITKSECPICKQPGWKKDLKHNHLIQNVVDCFRELIALQPKQPRKRHKPNNIRHDIGPSRLVHTAPGAAAVESEQHDDVVQINETQIEEDEPLETNQQQHHSNEDLASYNMDELENERQKLLQQIALLKCGVILCDELPCQDTSVSPLAADTGMKQGGTNRSKRSSPSKESHSLEDHTASPPNSLADDSHLVQPGTSGENGGSRDSHQAVSSEKENKLPSQRLGGLQAAFNQQQQNYQQRQQMNTDKNNLESSPQATNPVNKKRKVSEDLVANAESSRHVVLPVNKAARDSNKRGGDRGNGLGKEDNDDVQIEPCKLPPPPESGGDMPDDNMVDNNNNDGDIGGSLGRFTVPDSEPFTGQAAAGFLSGLRGPIPGGASGSMNAAAGFKIGFTPASQVLVQKYEEMQQQQQQQKESLDVVDHEEDTEEKKKEDNVVVVPLAAPKVVERQSVPPSGSGWKDARRPVPPPVRTSGVKKKSQGGNSLSQGKHRNIAAMFRAGHAKKAEEEAAVQDEPIYIATGRFSLDNRKKVNNLAQVLAGKVHIEEEIGPNTTHVLVETDAQRLVKNGRPWPFLHGLARGCWVVSFAWVDACIAAERRVLEKEYECKGVQPSIKFSAHAMKDTLNAPTRCRLRREQGKPGLFDGMLIYVAGFKQKSGTVKLSRDSSLRDCTINLIEAAGGVVVSSMSRLQNEKDVALRYILTNDTNIAATCEENVKGNILVLKPTWVLDSVMNGKILPKDHYRHTNSQL